MAEASFPADLRYTKQHEWAKEAGSKTTVGITSFAVEQLGDITLVNIDAKVGDSIAAGSTFGTIESVKTLSDLYAPVSGKVTEANSALEADPSLVNSSPEGDGWFFKLTLSNSGELEGLMDETAYKAFVAGL